MKKGYVSRIMSIAIGVLIFGTSFVLPDLSNPVSIGAGNGENQRVETMSDTNTMLDNVIYTLKNSFDNKTKQKNSLSLFNDENVESNKGEKTTFTFFETDKASMEGSLTMSIGSIGNGSAKLRAMGDSQTHYFVGEHAVYIDSIGTAGLYQVTSVNIDSKVSVCIQQESLSMDMKMYIDDSDHCYLKFDKFLFKDEMYIDGVKQELGIEAVFSRFYSVIGKWIDFSECPEVAVYLLQCNKSNIDFLHLINGLVEQYDTGENTDIFRKTGKTYTLTPDYQDDVGALLKELSSDLIDMIPDLLGMPLDNNFYDQIYDQMEMDVGILIDLSDAITPKMKINYDFDMDASEIAMGDEHTMSILMNSISVSEFKFQNIGNTIVVFDEYDGMVDARELMKG